MNRRFLDVPYREKDQAKSLGARFDWDSKRWYIQDGMDPAPFARWLSADALQGALPIALAPETAPAVPDSPATGTAVAAVRGISLSRLLQGVDALISQAYAQGVWTIVEISEARARGHVYLEVTERDADGRPLAKARAMIWESVASRILPAFEHATGAVLGAGMKLLVRAQPVFHAQYGFSLRIDAIDAEYTLGQMEARRREIRARLQREGVFDQNRQRPAPWDYRCVLVIAPAQAAGLGDFHREAERLQRCGVCRFVYAHSRFQGEGAAREIVAALQAALAQFPGGQTPDAVALIRGGGAVSDLAWLDDYDLARVICDLDIPVLTGIGHERDNTLADEVAHARFDTPSKVIAGIEQRIVQRVRETVALAQGIFGQAQAAIHQADAATGLLHSRIREAARQHVTAAARQAPQLAHAVQRQAQQHIQRAQAQSERAFQAVLAQSAAQHHLAAQRAGTQLQWVFERARTTLREARSGTEGLLREIMGQGPEKTLARGFVIVRAPDQQPLTSLAQAQAQPRLTLEFKDGRLPVTPS
ncbi:exodeoxyribonuclease VII large subunit [Castellaniella hirudinis]|uniref:exodeoxyribonuclease VII large subunit n=1 Tax=Castellaniella hirudinis TaxID=1144617 RepID=UPI0039C4A90B